MPPAQRVGVSKGNSKEQDKGKDKAKDKMYRNMFYIYVCAPKGKLIKLYVRSRNTIANVKTKIQNKVGLYPDQQLLRFDDMWMADGLTLEDYKIQLRSTIFLAERFRIYVMTSSTAWITLDVIESQTVNSVKNAIARATSIRPIEQLLCCKGVWLMQDMLSLRHYNIQKGSTLTLVQRIM